jgi:uncharacterized protein YjbI with pentapeptide repeats
MASLHESVEFTSASALPDDLRDAFRFCTFDGLDVEGPGFEGIAVGCTFKDSAWYWSLFVTAQFVDVEFRGCVFRGCSFADCVFARCKFVDCRFVKDNLNGGCRFVDCAWYDFGQVGCEGLPESFVPQR